MKISSIDWLRRSLIATFPGQLIFKMVYMKNYKSQLNTINYKSQHNTIKITNHNTTQSNHRLTIISDSIQGLLKPRSNVLNISPNIEAGKKAKTFQCSIEGGQMHRTFIEYFDMPNCAITRSAKAR